MLEQPLSADAVHPVHRRRKKNYFLKHWAIYSMILPGLAYFVLFRYIPIGGSIIAFQDYNIFNGVLHSRYVGLKHFENLFAYPDLMRIIKNTLLLSLYQLVFGFPAPIILALLLNEMRKLVFKRLLQTVLYLPHFLSWVIVGGLFISFLSPSTGLLNEVVKAFGGTPVFFMQEPAYIRSIIVVSGIWKEVGWGTILYLAALAGINPELYEAAEVDGAGRLRQTWSITLPSLLPTIVVLLLLRIGSILDTGFEQVYMFMNPLNTVNSEVFDTYIYRVGLLGAQYSYTTAIGIFKSVVGFILLMGANQLSRRATGESIY
ncbi:ABC transporter permease subunit [Paenibacillus aurantius]|uniref:ABC transporter permease subunit n=1 Tax=Paenibacillus aurantius TaxID=2918900 RepID=A0AA96LC62_9BACL|nr:ABC transporter permease subunit [Paenibacillus aurantius]WNQ09560.1 ABC transporter permease subunit [Paenibacillus aurantius]